MNIITSCYEYSYLVGEDGCSVDGQQGCSLSSQTVVPCSRRQATLAIHQVDTHATIGDLSCDVDPF